STGDFLTTWGSQGTGNGQFGTDVFGVATDGSGNVYVADTDNNRIQKFACSTTSASTTTSTTLPAEVCAFLTTWGSQGSANGQFNNPYGVATDGSGNVYVADTYNYRIEKFTSTGTFLTTWGSQGSDNGQFDSPQGVAADGSGN